MKYIVLIEIVGIVFFMFRHQTIAILFLGFLVAIFMGFLGFRYEDSNPKISNFFMYIFFSLFMILMTFHGVIISNSTASADSSFEKILIVVFLIAAETYFICLGISMIVKIMRIRHTDGLMCFALGTSFYIVINAFASIYLVLYLFNDTALLGVDNTSALTIYADMLYFSTVTFTTLGYGDIIPNHLYVKITVMVEVFLFAVALSYIIINIARRKDEK